MSKQENITRGKFNYLKKYYDKTWDENQHTLHVGLFKSKNDSLSLAYRQATDYLIKNAENILPISKDSRILDIGCGTGRTLTEICERFECSGVGIDLSDEQINDAKTYLKKLNLGRKKMIKTKFIRASASDLEKSLKKDQQFTHIISQDAILMVENKESLFNNINRLLAPGGVFAAADFLSESKAENRTQTEENLVYKLINWNKELSYNDYKKILKKIGLNIIKSERRNDDMIMTYDKLAKKMNRHLNDKEKTYAELKARYESISDSVKKGKMGWGLFFAQKPRQKTAIITGTNEKSIGRFVAEYLHKNGWNIWLYSRSAKTVSKLSWQERRCDISKEKSIDKLLDEIKNVDLVMMLADSGESHLPLEELSEHSVQSFINSKLVGSVLMTKAISKKFSKQENPVKIAWCGGKLAKKPKDLVLYGLANTAIAAYIDELNNHYPDIFEAYYLPTPIISPSTIGDEYIEKMGADFKALAKSPSIITDMIKQILDDKCKPGIINSEAKTL